MQVFRSIQDDDVVASIGRAKKRLEEGSKRTQEMLSTLSRAQQLMFNPAEVFDFAIVGQAYMGYLQDLRHGRHVGTDVELAIWALLLNHMDLIEQTDKAVAAFVNREHQKQFPNLLEQVYS